MPEDVNVVALVKGSERYVFLYDDASRDELLKVLGRFADEDDLSFTWYDAAVLSQKVRTHSALDLTKPKNSPLHGERY
jgi:hypothetical protein